MVVETSEFTSSDESSDDEDQVQNISGIYILFIALDAMEGGDKRVIQNSYRE